MRLDRAQELALEFYRQLAYLVEEERAAVRKLELARRAALEGPARQCAGFAAEELLLEEVAVQRGAVHGDEGPVRAAAGVVYGLGEQLLARAALALDEYVPVVMGVARGEGDGFLHARVVGDDVVEGVQTRDLV